MPSDNKLLVISSVWDSAGDANEFFDAYIDFMEEKSNGTWEFAYEVIPARDGGETTAQASS